MSWLEHVSNASNQPCYFLERNVALKGNRLTFIGVPSGEEDGLAGQLFPGGFYHICGPPARARPLQLAPMLNA